MTKVNNRSKEFEIKHLEILVCLFLVIAILAVYWRVQNSDFVNFDDDIYVTKNHRVQSGLTLESIKWAFSFSDKNNTYWQPVTWLSHILDYHLYDLRAGKHHLTNLIIHIANSLLLFVVFKWMTGAFWKSAFVAMLFAIHPINVDSVAWISERKNVLSTFFWMLTMLTYVYYSKQPVLYRYLLTLLVFALGLMTKPMLVTLPCVLFLLDYWPLGRISLWPPGVDKNGKSNKIIVSGYQEFLPFRLVLEKIPFFVLAALSIYVSSLSVRVYGNTVLRPMVPINLRIANALVSYVKYIGKTIWPQDLAVLYPFPRIVPMWQTIGALFLLVGISFFTIRSIRKAQFFVVGWLWYLGTLVPVIGLVQVGLWPAIADRFAYVPLIGIFIIVAWGIPELVAQWRYRKIWLTALATVVLTILMAATWKQVGYWKNSITLFEHTLKITSNNYPAHNNLGTALAKQGRKEEAIKHYLQALRIKPDYVEARNNLGNALDEQGRTEEAVKYYLQALQIKPDYVEARYNLGVALYSQGRTEEAIEHFLQALRIKPDYAEAHYNLGNALYSQGRTEEAVEHYIIALRIKPDYEKAHNNLGLALYNQDRTEEAIKHYLQALRIKPDSVSAHNNLGAALFRKGQIEKAVEHFKMALKVAPDYDDLRINLKKTLALLKEIDEAIAEIQKALKINPYDPELYYNLGDLFYRKGDLDKAIAQYQKALSIQPESVPALNRLAIIFSIQNKYDKALSLFKQIVTLHPDSAETYYNIACMYSKKQNTEESIAWLKKAIKKGYNNWNQIKTDKDLENIRNTADFKALIKDK